MCVESCDTFKHLRLWVVFLALTSVASVSATPAWAYDSSDLDLDPSHAPYRVDVLYSNHYNADTPSTTGYLMAELEGDGRLEVVTGNDMRILGWDCEDSFVKPRFQINLDPGWRFHCGVDVPLGVVCDLNGDRISEAYLTLKSDEGGAWRLMGIDFADNEIFLNVPLPTGEDRRPDGVWDGSYMAIGMLEDADGEGRPGVVLMCRVGYDANPRGLLVVDPHTGETIWQWVCGPNPDVSNSEVVDLDGDGISEIVFFGTSPDNLGGDLINGLSDDHAYLFVISAQGQELWRQELGGKFYAGSAEVADLNGDGLPEIITLTQINLTGEANKLIVWDYQTRQQVVSQRQEAAFLGLAVLPGPQPGTSWLVTGSNAGFLTRYLFTGDQLTRERRRMVGFKGCLVGGALDILPEPGDELVVNLGIGKVLAILDAELNPLAILHDDNLGGGQSPVMWDRSFDKRTLVVGQTRAQFHLDFVRKPFQVPVTAKIAAGVLLALILLGGAYRLGLAKARGGRADKTPVPNRPAVSDREVLYRMWRQLDDVKHEKFLEANRGLRRLVWLLEAYAADLGASDTLGVRIGQLMEDFSDSVRPRLLEILHLARTEHFEIESVQQTTLALESLGNHLESLDVETLTLDSVRERSDEMNAELTKVEAGFLDLWQALRQYFTTDPVRMLQGMLLVREVEFQRAGIETRIVGADVTEPLCLIDSSSLRFILDNLVDNGFRAMADSSTKVLRVDVERRQAELVLQITDTGKGIETEEQEDIFNGRTSDRPGGGAGLFRSQELLQKWRGELILAKSAPGQGTTFIVKLRAANEIDATDETVKTLYGKN